MPGQERLGSFIGRRKPGGAGAEEPRSIHLEHVEPARSSGGRPALQNSIQEATWACRKTLKAAAFEVLRPWE